MDMIRNDKLVWPIIIILALVTLAVYWPVQNYGFCYDDSEYISENTLVQSGLNSQSLKWAFTTGHSSNWHPLTWLSLMVDCQIFGLNPAAHHLMNLFFHIANTVLLFLIFTRMTKEIWASAFIAALFALHPLKVESVAWIAERKDVLSTLFALLTIAAYITYTQKPKTYKYWLIAVLFALGLMAKPMLVTLPFVLLLLDYWPLNRLQLNTVHDQLDNCLTKNQKKTILQLLAEKIPLFILAIASSVVTYLVQQRTGAMEMSEQLPLNIRIANAFTSYIGYISKMIYPAKLAVLYPHLQRTLLSWQPIAALLILITVSIVVIVNFRRYRFLTVGWLWYLGTLVPVIGIIQVGRQAMADRYMYLTSIGISIIIAYTVAELSKKSKTLKTFFAIAALAIIVIFSTITRAQLPYWKNNMVLYEHALAVTKNNPIIHYNLGTELKKIDKPDEAIKHLKRAVLLRPDFVPAHNNLGLIYMEKGQLGLAIQRFKKAIQIDPDFTNAINNIGLVLQKQGKTDQAIEKWKRVIQINPDYLKAHYNIAVAMSQKGNFNKAIEHFRHAIRIDPTSADVYYKLGVVLLRSNKDEEAINAFGNALTLNPDYIKAHNNLAEILYKKGMTVKAIQHWEKIIELNPNSTKIYNNLAWVLAASKDKNIRDPKSAVDFAKKACELTKYKQFQILDTLSVAYAANGNFTEAVKTAERAIKMAIEEKQKKQADDIATRLKLYKHNEPYYD